MANDKKEYSMADVQSMLQTVVDAVKTGNYQNTVFGAPQDASSYDAAAATANGMVNYLVGKYSNEMLAAQRLKRTTAVTSAIGAGPGGSMILNTLRSFNPSMADNLIGLHGADAATQSMLLNANNIAYATGRSVGGMSNPHQLATNYRWAATQGALALNNNFNEKGGTLNADFTYGLNLQQAAVVGNNILANASQYDDWASRQLERTAKWKAENQNLEEGSGKWAAQRKKDGILTSDEINAFRSGTGMTSDAVRSFNDHIKNFQKEMNGFVASVSKITGSFDTAIDFIQDLTNGKAFDAGAKAAKTREKAAMTAANLRAMASDAGMAPGMMYSIVKGMGGSFDAAFGRSYDEQIVGDRSVSANVASMAGGAFAQWAKTHQGASQEEQERMMYRINSRVKGFAAGDASKDNVILAMLVKNGAVSKDEALRMIRSGRQGNVGRFLKQKMGGNLEAIRSNRVTMDWFTRENADLVNEFNAISLNEGISNEAVLRNQQNAMTQGRTVLSSMLSAAYGKSMTNEVEDIHKNALRNRDVLKSAGLNDSQIEDVLSKKSMTARGLHKYISGLSGVDEFTLNSAVAKNMTGALESRFGKNDKAQAALKVFGDMMKAANPEIDDKKRKQLMINDRMAAKNDEINAKKVAMLKGGAGDLDLVNSIADAASGKDGTILSDNRFVKSALEDKLGNLGLTSDAATQLEQLGMNEYQAARDAGLDSTAALRQVQKTLNESKLMGGKKMEGLESSEERKRLAERYSRKNAAIALFNRMLESYGGDMDDAAKEDSRKKFLRNLKSENFDVKRDEKDTDDDYAKKVYASIGNAVVNAASGSDKDGKDAAIAPDKMSTGDMFQVVQTKGARETIRKSFLALFDRVTGDAGLVAPGIDPRKLTQEQRRELDRRILAEGDQLFNPFAARANAGGDANSVFAASASALGDKHSKDLQAAADSADAKNRGKVLGELDDLDKEIIDSKLHMGDKMDVLRDMFVNRKDDKGNYHQSLLTRVRNSLGTKGIERTFKKKQGQVTNRDLAKYFQNLLTLNADLDEKDFRKAAAEGKLKGGEYFNSLDLDVLLDAKDAKGNAIPLKESLSAFVAAAGVNKSDKDALDNALKEGYRNYAMSKSDSAVSVQATDYLKRMTAALETLAGSKNTK